MTDNVALVQHEMKEETGFVFTFATFEDDKVTHLLLACVQNPSCVVAVVAVVAFVAVVAVVAVVVVVIVVVYIYCCFCVHVFFVPYLKSADFFSSRKE